jgi:hypothetical protein
MQAARLKSVEKLRARSGARLAEEPFDLGASLAFMNFL